MPIPKRFSPGANLAAEQLRSQIETLPAAEKEAALKVIEGAVTPLPSLTNPGSTAVPGTPAIPQPALGAPIGASPTEVFALLALLKTATKEAQALSPSLKILLDKGLAVSAHGYVILTTKGLGYLVDFGLL